jgi:hypothetical protein
MGRGGGLGLAQGGRSSFKEQLWGRRVWQYTGRDGEGYRRRETAAAQRPRGSGALIGEEAWRSSALAAQNSEVWSGRARELSGRPNRALSPTLWPHDMK